MFLAVEGSVMTAEEIKNPEKNLSRGLCTGMITLLVFSFLTVFITFIFTSKSSYPVDFPLAQVMSTLYGYHSKITFLVAGLELFGLAANLNGLIIGLSREIFALSRAKNMPSIFSKLSKRHQLTYAIMVPYAIALLCSYSANLANALVGLSVIGAIFMYALTLAAYCKICITPHASQTI